MKLSLGMNMNHNFNMIWYMMIHEMNLYVHIQMNVFTNIYELIAPQKQATSEALLQDAWWRGGHFDVVFMEGQGRANCRTEAEALPSKVVGCIYWASIFATIIPYICFVVKIWGMVLMMPMRWVSMSCDHVTWYSIYLWYNGHIHIYIYTSVCGASVGGRLPIGFVSFSNPNSCFWACVRPCIYFGRSMLLFWFHTRD